MTNLIKCINTKIGDDTTDYCISIDTETFKPLNTTIHQPGTADIYCNYLPDNYYYFDNNGQCRPDRKFDFEFELYKDGKKVYFVKLLCCRFEPNNRPHISLVYDWFEFKSFLD